METLGIDASNVRAGGGLTHLREMLSVADPASHGFDRVIIWGGSKTIDCMPRRSWIDSRPLSILDAPLPARVAWQQTVLPRSASKQVDILFTPGATPTRRATCPVVTMSQNMLPFEDKESSRYGLSWKRARLAILRRTQRMAFESADGLLFPTGYARNATLRKLRHIPAAMAVVPHGVSPRFRREPSPQFDMSVYSERHPFQFLYVSIVEAYKHQWHVGAAVADLRKEGFPVAVDFVGRGATGPLARLRRTIKDLDPGGHALCYKGGADYGRIEQLYHSADAFVFASSCESISIILLEAMASGLPIASSSAGPMPEVLEDAAVFFSPTDREQIREALRVLLLDPKLRAQLARRAYTMASDYTWERCADETLGFIRSVLDASSKRGSP